MKMRRLAMLALCLTLITACLMSGTMAKYTTTVNGSGTVTTASWAPEVTVNSTKLADTATVTISSDKVYPGKTIELPVTVKNGSDTVAATYTLEITTANLPTNMVVKYGNTTLNGTSGKFTTEAAEVAANTTSTATNLVLEWPFGADKDDTADAGKTITVTIKAVVDQKQATA